MVRYRLYSCFLLIAALSAPLAVIAARVRYYKRQETIASRVEPLGATVKLKTTSTDWVTAWILNGGQRHVSSVHIESDHVFEVLTALQECGASGVAEVDIVGESSNVTPVVSEHAIELLAEFPNLGLLSIGFADVSTESLRRMDRLERLTYLSLYAVGMTDSDLASLSVPTSLEYLSIESNFITDDGLQYLSRFPNLRKIGVEFTAITERGEQRLKAGRPELIVVYRRKQSTIDGLAKQVARLQTGAADWVQLRGDNILDSDLACLKGVEGIRELDLNSTWVTGVGLEFILHPDKVEKLDLANCPLDPGAYQQIGRFRNLQYLDLSHTSATNSALKELLPQLPLLNQFNLVGCPIDDEIVPLFADMKHLNCLLVDDTRITEYAINRLYERNPGLVASVSVRQGVKNGETDRKEN